MTDREHWEEILPMIHAYVNGEVIQHKEGMGGEWVDVGDEEDFDDFAQFYRIKPGPTYRAFETAEECWQEMLKHEPFGWLHNKKTNSFVSAKVIGLKAPDEEGVDGVAYSIVFEKYTFADGTPFGFKEE